ncbi:MAG: Ferritin-like domain protein [Syntrophus sp. PtaU1.Bin005]|jgi:bacterioferritin|uniref:ferritin-like domain-containing protein n=1 Tax=Syntrophus TaxID=43773 RepID=UPI0009C763A6|nr:MAG: Ferritin-like domain protein [Syntrophus sp. PtaB.Bin138]OPY80777.1 MAG: Ferritin-like domain protein [Syntrophus sp. PtaU1.Bin005]
MDTKELIDMLNRDFADEHAAIIRYLVHAYQEGEDTPMGAGLLSRSREEMWHMHWLGMIIGRLGGEPDFTPGPYPFDPTSRATMLKSYIEYEEKLIPHYHGEAEKVDDPHIRRVLHREAWESAIHARRFQRMLDKLSPEDAGGLPQGDHELPPAFLEMLQQELIGKYNEMLRHLRLSWLSQRDGAKGWALMDQSMEKMKQLALFAEAVAEDGAVPRLIPESMDAGQAVEQALRKALGDVREALGRHTRLQEDGEFKKHSGLVMKMDLTVQQESHQAEEIEDWLK